MKYSSIFVAGFAFIALVGVAPVAWSGSMGNGAAQRSAEFAKSNAKTCLALPHDKMMKDQGCKSVMAQHPELFPSADVKPNSVTPH